jgi:hypothetical protein
VPRMLESGKWTAEVVNPVVEVFCRLSLRAANVAIQGCASLGPA